MVRKIIKLPTVMERTGLSRTSIWRKVRGGTFVAPLRLGPNSVGWYEDEVVAYVEALPRVAYAPTPAPLAA